MNLVVDASALCDAFLGRARAIEALDPKTHGRRAVLHVPELVDSETLHTLRRWERSGAISTATASRYLDRFAVFPLVRHRHAPLRRRVWAHRHNLSAYDATYLALAEVIHGSVLVTADAALATHARTSLGDDRVRLVG